MTRKITREDRERDIRRRMLSGKPFSYGGLVADGFEPNGTRIVDNMIQKLRKSGLISFKRVGGRVVWTATEAGLQECRELTV